MIKTPVELQDGLIYDANGVLVLDVATEMDGEYLASIINNHAHLLRIAEAAEELADGYGSSDQSDEWSELLAALSARKAK
jgi:hypothetical protein